MGAKATIKDVARMAGVSHMTVVRTLEGGAKVKESTRSRVLDACKSLNYRRNLAASQLRNANSRSRIIAVILPTIQHSYYSTILDHFGGECRKSNYHVLMHKLSLDEAVSSTWSDLDFLLARNIDGLVIFGMLPAEIAGRLKDEKIPMVFIDFKPSDPKLPFIGTDDYHGGREISDYLIGLGHRRIAFIAGPQGHYTSDRRLAGHLAAMKAAKLRPHVVYSANMRTVDGSNSMAGIIGSGVRFSAVAAANDYLAMGAISACTSRGMAVPRDISVAGFAGVEEGAFTVPPLTTMAQDMPGIGRGAFQILMDIGRDRPGRRQMLFPAKLLLRGSCAPPARRRAD